MFADRNSTNSDFSAEDFVNNLLSEGDRIACDETEESFINTIENEVPAFYEEQLFKKGQAFYHKHIFAMFVSKFFGLITILAIPSILNILKITNMSSSNYTAYRRYLSTIFHMNLWYQSDFKPGSKLWKSIADVRKRHNSASKKGCTMGLGRISQKDMALTQFGFMGFALTRVRLVGIYNSTDEEWKAFIHVWRVIGHLMGIHERFNICRESVQETKEICTILIERVFEPQVQKREKPFLEMMSYLVHGMWCMQPILNYKVSLLYLLNMLVNENGNNNNRKFINNIQLTRTESMILNVMNFNSYALRFTIYRGIQNSIQHIALWLMKNCPFLAYYKFGKANSFVYILDQKPQHR